MKTAPAKIKGHKIHRTSQTELWKFIQQFIQEAKECGNCHAVFHGLWNFLGQISGYSFAYLLK